MKSVSRLTTTCLLVSAIFFNNASVLGQLATVPSSAKLDAGLTVLLSYSGFLAKKIYIKTGNIGMMVQNRSALTNLTFQLTRDGDSAALLTSKHSAAHRDNTFFFSIDPGIYHLSVVEQPSWQCVLNVSAN